MSEDTTTTQGIFDTEELANKAKIMIDAYSAGLYDAEQITARAIFDGMNDKQIHFLKNEMSEIAERRELLAQKIKEEYERKTPQEKENEQQIIGRICGFFNSFFSKYPRPLPLIPGLSQEEAEKTVYAPEKERAEYICHQLPAIIHNIQIISERGNKGYGFLKEHGAIFNTTENIYTPQWGTRYFSNIIKEEQNRRLYLYMKLYEKAYKTIIRQAFLETEIDEMRKLRKHAISELRKFPDSLNAFYNSAYFQAYTIAQAVPIKYQQKESDIYTIHEMSLLYFFATANLKPDEPASLTMSDEMKLTSIIQGMDNFFLQNSNNRKTQYATLISFINHNIRLLELPDEPQRIAIIPKTAAALSEPLRFPQIAMYDKSGNLLQATDETQRIIVNALQNYYYAGAGVFKRPPERPITVKFRDFIKTITSRPPVNLTGNKWTSYARQTINEIQTLKGIIDGREYQLIGAAYYEPETDDFSFRSEYFQYWYERLQKTSKKLIDRETKKEITIQPVIAFLHYDVAREKKEIQELAYEIFAKMQNSQAKKYYHYCPARLISKHCPALLAKINAAPTSAKKTEIIRRAYQRFYKILKEKTDFYEYFLPPKDEKGSPKPLRFCMINTRTKKREYGEVYPTYKNWQYVTIEIEHGGRNPKYHA